MIPKRKKKRRLGIIQGKQVKLDTEKQKLLTKIAIDAMWFAFNKGCRKVDGITVAAISSVILTSKEISDKLDYVLTMKWATDIFIQEVFKLSHSTDSISLSSN